ncbi:hypothetical protein F4775DRAFT_241324 [Biscogniauxia sp. FL1348]|nr:hypothetical protein F4775DRAFT_241324 [Biscogniauxia sp. FL1348]
MLGNADLGLAGPYPLLIWPLAFLLRSICDFWAIERQDSPLLRRCTFRCDTRLICSLTPPSLTSVPFPTFLLPPYLCNCSGLACDPTSTLTRSDAERNKRPRKKRVLTQTSLHHRECTTHPRGENRRRHITVQLGPLVSASGLFPALHLAKPSRPSYKPRRDRDLVNVQTPSNVPSPWEALAYGTWDRRYSSGNGQFRCCV